MKKPPIPSLRPLGYLSSCYQEKFGTPRQPRLAAGARASLQLEKEFSGQGMLDGLEHFSHVWLVFLFHQNTNKSVTGKIRPPRLQGQSLGVLATRSPHRPNPIGLSLVKLEKVEGDRLEFSGVDLIDGTPILDIKPYIEQYDSTSQASKGWLENLDHQILEVHFTDPFYESLLKVRDQSPWNHETEELCQLIKESLQHDPRPFQHRKQKDTETSTNKDHYGFKLYHLDVRFVFEEDHIQVVEVEDLS